MAAKYANYVGDKFYEPTGLFHPSYELANSDEGILADTSLAGNDP